MHVPLIKSSPLGQGTQASFNSSFIPQAVFDEH